MEKKDVTKNLIAGLFFLSGIVLILFVILTIGKDKGLTQSRFQVTVLFSDVGGLIEGAPIRLSGVNVGNVAHIDFLDQPQDGRAVRVICNIFNKYENQFKNEVQFFVKTEGILGQKLIELVPKEGGGSFDVSKPVLGEYSIEIQELAEVFAQAAQSFTSTSEELSKIEYDELSEVVAETARQLAQTAAGINKVLAEMEVIARKSKRIMDRVEQKIIDDELFKVF